MQAPQAQDDPLQDGTRMSARRGCSLALGLAVIGTICVLALAVLIVRGEWRLAPNRWTEARLWIVRQENIQGLGVGWSRPRSETAEQVCVDTTVRFVLWQSDGSSPTSQSCQCYRQIQGQWRPGYPCP